MKNYFLKMKETYLFIFKLKFFFFFRYKLNNINDKMPIF